MIPDSLLVELARSFPAVVVLLYVTWRQEKLIDLVIAVCMRHFEAESDENSDPG
jgi:hypothetical protein